MPLPDISQNQIPQSDNFRRNLAFWKSAKDNLHRQNRCFPTLQDITDELGWHKPGTNLPDKTARMCHATFHHEARGVIRADYFNFLTNEQGVSLMFHADVEFDRIARMDIDEHTRLLLGKHIGEVTKHTSNLLRQQVAEEKDDVRVLFFDVLELEYVVGLDKHYLEVIQ